MSSSARVKEVRSQLEALNAAPVTTSAKVVIDREMTPIIEELLMLQPWNDQYPAVTQLFNWLVEPNRTAGEFVYVVRHLGKDVYYTMQEEYDVPDEDRCSLGKIATEALAAKGLVLEDQWELAAWFVVWFAEYYDFATYGSVSDHASAWIITMIGNADFCPNADLRIEFMSMLWRMVKLNDQNRSVAFECVMSACSSLKVDFVTEAYYGYEYSNLKFSHITCILEEISSEGNISTYDQNLAKNLFDVKSHRISFLLRLGNANKCEPNPKKYAEPKEMYTLISLLRATSYYTQVGLKKCMDLMSPFPPVEASSMLKVIVCNFKVSCQMPQLISQTASCVMDVMEFALMFNLPKTTENNLILIDRESLFQMEYVLRQLTIDSGEKVISKTLVGRQILHNYAERLIEIEERIDYVLEVIGDISFPDIFMIVDLVYSNGQYIV